MKMLHLFMFLEVLHPFFGYTKGSVKVRQNILNIFLKFSHRASISLFLEIFFKGGSYSSRRTKFCHFCLD
jgi:hypothetical protein